MKNIKKMITEKLYLIKTFSRLHHCVQQMLIDMRYDKTAPLPEFIKVVEKYLDIEK